MKLSIQKDSKPFGEHSPLPGALALLSKKRSFKRGIVSLAKASYQIVSDWGCDGGSGKQTWAEGRSLADKVFTRYLKTWLCSPAPHETEHGVKHLKF